MCDGFFYCIGYVVMCNVTGGKSSTQKPRKLKSDDFSCNINCVTKCIKVDKFGKVDKRKLYPVDKLERVQIGAHWNNAKFGNLPQDKSPRKLNYLKKT